MTVTGSIIGGGLHHWLTAHGPATLADIRAQFCADTDTGDVDAAAVNRLVYSELAALETTGVVLRLDGNGSGLMLWTAR